MALLLGGIASLALIVAFTVFDDPCPGYDDEGSMAAPDSPYSQVMCDPAMVLELSRTTQVPIPMALLISTAIAVTAAALLVWRRPRMPARRSLAAGVAGVLLLQPFVVVVLNYTLPRDCLSGRTETGECGRDRELR